MSHHEDVETMGGRIRQARKAARLTQEALAELAEMNRVSVADLERNKQRPSADTLRRIAQATGQAMDWFFEGTDEKMAPPPEPPPAPSNPLQKEEPVSGPDTHALLAQLVAAQTQMLQAQVRAEERADQRHNEMMQALTALAREQMQARAEAARTQRRLDQVEVDLRETDEGDDADCCEGQKACTG